MEAAEDTSLQPAVGWLAENILGSLQIDGMDAWMRRAGLLNEIEGLKSEVETVQIIVADKRVAGNNLLVPCLAGLKKLLYDAEEVVDELDYYRLEQQVKGVTWQGPESMPEPDLADEESMADVGIPSSSAGKKRTYKNEVRSRSAAWDHFNIFKEKDGDPVEAECKHCKNVLKCGPGNGTNVLLRHPKTKKCLKARAAADQPLYPSSSSCDVTPVIVGKSSSRKRMRTNKESVQLTTTSTPPWNMTEFSGRISEITCGLQKILQRVNKVLNQHGSGSASSDHHQTTTSDQHLRTSSVLPRKVFGRAAEKNRIIKLITENKSDSVTVLPIVGIGGIGKTTLAQLVYNDPGVKRQFCHRIWVRLSHNFDEVRLIKEMLDFIPQKRTEIPEESLEGISSFPKLQEILASRAKSKRLLFILDDVWDDMNDGRWENLLKTIESGCANGSVILVTTRDDSVAKLTGTTEQINLGALEHDEFQLLFKLHAFDDENYKSDQNLCDIAQKIADKLRGNPLAAESTGKLLSKKRNSDNWNNILKNEDWKSLQLSRGIMAALKLSFDQLPYNLRQCFAYCSIFPDGYEFLGGELARIWISQGFVKGNHSTMIAEEIEQNYLTRLVSLGFFQQVEREESSPRSQIYYAVCGLMHDFARMASLTECATIDGIQCNKMSRTVRHLSIVTDSVYIKDEHGNIPRNEKFEKNMRDTVTSVSKLRTLVLLGHYDSFFLQLFQDMFQEANNLRLLQMSARSADFLKCGPDEMNGALPQVLSKLYHLQVLNVGSYTDPTIPDGINNLVSLQNIIVHKGAYSSITTIDSMTPFQKPHGFKVQISSGLEMTQLQSKDEFVQHWMHVKTLEEAYEAGLRNNELSEKLLLPWNETPWDIAMELERQPRQDIHNLQISGYGATMFSTLDNCSIYNCKEWKILPSLGRFPFLAKLILSSLEKVIQVLLPSLEELVLFEMPKLERCTCTSVEGMNSSLRALQIEKCGALKEFDLFKNDGEFEIEQRPWLPGLTKLILRDCPDLEMSRPLPPSTTVYELLVERVSTLPYMKGSSSEHLYIRSPDEYDGEEDFDEFSDELRMLDDKILAFHNLRNLKSMSINGFGNRTCIPLKGSIQLVSLKRLQIYMCRQLFSLDVMPEDTLEDGSAANGKAFPSLESLSIDSCGVTGKWICLLLKHVPYLEELNLSHVEEEENGQPNRISAREHSSSGKHGGGLTGLAQDRLVHIPLNLVSSLKKISIHHCPRPTFNLSEEGFSVFTSIQELKVQRSPELFSSLVHKDGNDDVANGRCLLPTSLQECVLWGDDDVKTLQPCFLSDLTNLRKLEVGSCEALESLQLQWCTALQELKIGLCGSLTAIEGLQFLVSLRKLDVQNSPGLKSLEMHSCTALEELKIEDCESLTTLEGPQSLLKKLEVDGCPALESLQLPLCVALEELIIYDCELLTTLEGLQFLGSLKHLALSMAICPGLPPWLESFSRQGYELCPRLETLEMDDPSLLTTSFCESRTSLQRLQLISLVLSEEQGGALVLIKSLQELEFSYCHDLVDLPAGLHLLPSLKKLKIEDCLKISRLPDLPLSLEELELEFCSKKLADRCRALAPSKLIVKINRCF